jgi:hypothetical protein
MRYAVERVAQAGGLGAVLVKTKTKTDDLDAVRAAELRLQNV